MPSDVRLNFFVRSNQRRGAACGLAAAALFGMSPPLAKLLLPEAGPLLIAGLLYLGAGVGLLVFERVFYRGSETSRRETQVGPSDRWLLAGIVFTGGILGPVFMLWGLQRVTGVFGSLLLNLEAPFTIVLALLLFREHLGRVEGVGAVLIIIAAALLSWALDNNLSQRLSFRDPIVVTRIKTLSAGVCTLSLAVVVDHSLPRPLILIAALLLGVLSYGVSLVLDMQALRLLGAAREAGFFATAPFIGALAAVPLLGERWGSHEIVATVVMVLGVGLLLSARHHHIHVHAEVLHDHTHVHEDHHDHEHEGEHPIEEPHAHLHGHLPLMHDHPHVSDLHHRHEHG